MLLNENVEITFVFLFLVILYMRTLIDIVLCSLSDTEFEGGIRNKSPTNQIFTHSSQLWHEVSEWIVLDFYGKK